MSQSLARPRKHVITAISFGLIALLIVMHPGATIAMSTPEPLVQPQEMQEYRIGRFAVKVPAGMTLDHQGTRIQFREVEEFLWPQNLDHETAWKTTWDARLAEISSLRPPQNQSKAIIESKDLSINNQPAKAIFYFGDSMTDKRAHWDLLLNAGHLGVWIKGSGRYSSKEDLFKYIVEIATAYRLPPPQHPHRGPGKLELPATRRHCLALFGG